LFRGGGGGELLNVVSSIMPTPATVLRLTRKVEGDVSYYTWIIIFHHLNCPLTYTIGNETHVGTVHHSSQGMPKQHWAKDLKIEEK